jgi:hypothetical protein
VLKGFYMFLRVLSEDEAFLEEKFFGIMEKENFSVFLYINISWVVWIIGIIYAFYNRYSIN